MQQDDRLFIILLGCFVTATAAVILGLQWDGLVGAISRRPAVTRLESTPAVTATEPAVLTSAGRAGRRTGVDGPAVEPASFELGGDALVRRLVGELSVSPSLDSWLATDHPLERFVRLVDAVANGHLPHDLVSVGGQWREVLVRADGDDRLVLAAGTYRRYTPGVRVFASIDPVGAVDLYRRLRPQLAEAAAEIGLGGTDLDERLEKAIDHLLEAPAVSGAIEVEQRSHYYAFADDEYERLSEAQKHMLRMGAENEARVRAELVALRAAFGWEAPAPSEVVLAEAGEAVPATTDVRVARLDPGAVEEGPKPSPATVSAAGEPATP